jgi:esterase/lipase
MKKIIFFHGYGGEPIPEITEIFKYIGYNTIQQYIDYDEEWEIDKCKSITEESIELAKDCDVIIGLSLGGYTAHLIANHLQKKCILINPGLDRDRSLLHIKEFNYPHIVNNCPLEVFLGGRDFQIPNHYTTEFLERKEIESRVEKLDEMYHVFNLDEFIDIVKMSNFILK